VDWCCLDSRGVSGRILLCGIARWWRKSNSVWGSLFLLVLLEMSNINLLGLLRVFMALILIVIEGFNGMNWLVFLIGGTCRGALREISTSLFFLVRNRVKSVFVQLWWSSQISFLIRSSSIFLW